MRNNYLNNSKIKVFLNFLILNCIVSLCFAQTKEVSEWRNIFSNSNVKGTFVLKNLCTQEVLVHNPERSQRQYIPASSFKVLNSLISLQEGVVARVDDIIKWDGIQRNYSAWNQDRTMRSGIKVSCVWFYQELARRVGEERMQYWLDETAYGNRKIENAIDQFWLVGNLKISALEQVQFIERLVNNELPFDAEVQEVVKSIIITDTGENYTIHSKTGWNGQVGWNIGFVITNKGTWCFAVNMDLSDLNSGNKRIEITKEVLKQQGVL